LAVIKICHVTANITDGCESLVTGPVVAEITFNNELPNYSYIDNNSTICTVDVKI